MKFSILFLLVLSFVSFDSFSQTSNSNIKVGDTFTIGVAQNDNYKHIKFPKSNFIIKKGGIPNFKNLPGEKVEVTSLNEKKDGSFEATIKLTSNKRFFNSHKYVSVDIAEAIEKKELIRN